MHVPDDKDTNDECIEIQDEPSENVEEQENLTLKQKLYKMIEKKTLPVPLCPIKNKLDKKNIIKTEIKQLFEQSSKGTFMKVLYDSLLSIAPTSVESEIAFTAAGLFCTKIRTSLSDSTLNVLCFLKHYLLTQKILCNK